MLKASAGGGGRGMRAVAGPEELGGGVRSLPQRGGGRVRQRRAVRRATGRPAASHRGADPRRPARQRRPPVRPRLLRAAPQPEGRRGRAGARPRSSSCASRCSRVPIAAGRRSRLRQRRHRRVPRRAGDRRALLHRVQPADPGRAHRDGAGDRRRPRRGAVPDRCRRVARRPRHRDRRPQSSTAASPCRRGSSRREPAC